LQRLDKTLTDEFVGRLQPFWSTAAERAVRRAPLSRGALEPTPGVGDEGDDAVRRETGKE
jgi:hypothetical protein